MSPGGKSFSRHEMLGASLQASPADRRVQKVLQAIEADPSREIQELAQLVNLSSSRLSHVFKAATGISLQGFLSDARLQRAAQLLESTDMAVKEISYHVGYRHAPSFVRAFRSKVGTSPNDYRSRQRIPLSNSESG